MCTVSCALLTASRVPTILELNKYMRASRVPRRNWYNCSARTDDGALLRGRRREERASTVQCEGGDRRLVRTDDLGDGERVGREEYQIARRCSCG
jgi:hypothetical protein